MSVKGQKVSATKPEKKDTTKREVEQWQVDTTRSAILTAVKLARAMILQANREKETDAVGDILLESAITEMLIEQVAAKVENALSVFDVVFDDLPF